MEPRHHPGARSHPNNSPNTPTASTLFNRTVAWALGFGPPVITQDPQTTVAAEHATATFTAAGHTAIFTGAPPWLKPLHP